MNDNVGALVFDEAKMRAHLIKCFEDMIMCDRCSNHYRCTKIRKEPVGNWFCSGFMICALLVVYVLLDLY